MRSGENQRWNDYQMYGSRSTDHCRFNSAWVSLCADVLLRSILLLLIIMGCQVLIASQHYWFSIPSCRSPPGCSSCLCLPAAPHPPSTRRPAMVAVMLIPQSFLHPLDASGRRWALIYNCQISWGRTATTKCLLIKIPLLLAFDSPKVFRRLEIFSDSDW